MQIQNSSATQKVNNRDRFLVIENVSKVYPTPSGPYTVIEDVSLAVSEGEFICIIGHSGCGKSTLLNMVAGFGNPTDGEVRLQNQRITKPGPDRMMVFQNYSLLPWKTAFENVYLAVKSVYPKKSKAEKVAIAQEHLAMVGLTEAADKKPSQLSGGMKQRVAIARALAIRPQVLILDEPFGALDAITKEEMQEELLQIWRDHRVTVLMITHDIDEALFLADKVVMMTNGPAARIGEVLEIPFQRPRARSRIIEDPRYYELRNYALDFLFHRFARDEAQSTLTETDIPSQARSRYALKTTAAIASLTLAAIAGVGLFRWVSTSKSTDKTPTQTIVTQPSLISTPTPTPSPSLTSPAPEITDPAKLEELNQKLFDQIDKSWQITPTFEEDLVYRVKVKLSGAIASYESVNQAASDYLLETPFPTLVKSTSPATQDDPQQPLAPFQVVLTPTGVLEVKPWSDKK